MTTRRPPLRKDATPEQQEAAIVDAAAREFAEVGFRRASMDRIARLSGVSRSTLYRRFPNRDELLSAVGAREREVWMARLITSAKGLNARDAFVEAFCEAFKQLQEVPLLRRMLDIEPDVVERLLGVRSDDSGILMNQLIDAISDTLQYAGATMPRDQLRIVVETYIRIIASFVNLPSITLDLTDDAQMREYAARYLAPMIH